MRAWVKTSILSCLASCAAACSTPQPVPPPKLVDVNSEEIRNELAAERQAALKLASISSANVTREFYVGWEMHYGYHLIPVDAPNDLVSVEFLDDNVLHQFDVARGPGIYPAGVEIPHLGQRLVCECTGIEWKFYDQQQFLVRAAKLVWK